MDPFLDPTPVPLHARTRTRVLKELTDDADDLVQAYALGAATGARDLTDVVWERVRHLPSVPRKARILARLVRAGADVGHDEAEHASFLYTAATSLPEPPLLAAAALALAATGEVREARACLDSLHRRAGTGASDLLHAARAYCEVGAALRDPTWVERGDTPLTTQEYAVALARLGADTGDSEAVARAVALRPDEPDVIVAQADLAGLLDGPDAAAAVLAPHLSVRAGAVLDAWQQTLRDGADADEPSDPVLLARYAAAIPDRRRACALLESLGPLVDGTDRTALAELAVACFPDLPELGGRALEADDLAARLRGESGLRTFVRVARVAPDIGQRLHERAERGERAAHRLSMAIAPANLDFMGLYGGRPDPAWLRMAQEDHLLDWRLWRVRAWLGLLGASSEDPVWAARRGAALASVRVSGAHAVLARALRDTAPAEAAEAARESLERGADGNTALVAFDVLRATGHAGDVLARLEQGGLTLRGGIRQLEEARSLVRLGRNDEARTVAVRGLKRLDADNAREPPGVREALQSLAGVGELRGVELDGQEVPGVGAVVVHVQGDALAGDEGE